MDFDAQLQTTDIDLSKATMADLIKELRNRSNAVVVVMVADDDEGDETVVVYRLGSRFTSLGALEYAREQIASGES